MARPRSLVVPPVEQLGPKTTQRVLEQIDEEEEEQEPEEEMVVDGNNIQLIPMQLSLSVDAPIDAVKEMQQLYIINKNIMLQLKKNSKPGKPHPQLLGYLKQASECVEKIYKMTESVQQEANLEKLKIVRTMFEMNTDLSDELKIRFLKEMHNKAQLKKAAGK